MADCTFRDLCLDAADAGALARFWAEVLGGHAEPGEDGEWHLGPAAGSSWGLLSWVDPVPEPRSVKTRVHLDLRLPVADPAPLVAAGATLVRAPDDEVRWWVLEDPEGNAFCAFPPAPPEWGLPAVDRPTPFELVVDCQDAWAQASWWAARTGGTPQRREGTAWAWVEGAAGFPMSYWVFTPVPERKTVKNRMHWDVLTERPEPSALVTAGATVLREPGGDIRWWVLADPEGNEFCAFAPGD